MINTVIARQYRKKVEEGMPHKSWESCGEYTYNTFKERDDHEVRRLTILPEDTVCEHHELVDTRFHNMQLRTKLADIEAKNLRLKEELIKLKKELNHG